MPVPFLSTPDKAITDSTQDLLPVIEVTDGIVIYKNGGASLIMESTSLNFGLLSEREQDAVIASYAGLLNSFNFPVQIVVRSQKKDISIYMEFLKAHEDKVKTPKLLGLMQDYEKFIQEAIKKKNVLSKKFYIVIPFTPLELGIAKSFMSALRLPSQTQKPLPYPKSYVVRKAKIALFPKRDHLIRQARRLAVQFKPLSDKELVELFYNAYNPEPPVKEQDVFG